MPDKRDIEERLSALERTSHYHEATDLKKSTPDPEESQKQILSEEDSERAKSRGSIFGDPVFVVDE